MQVYWSMAASGWTKHWSGGHKTGCECSFVIVVSVIAIIVFVAWRRVAVVPPTFRRHVSYSDRTIIADNWTACESLPCQQQVPGKKSPSVIFWLQMARGGRENECKCRKNSDTVSQWHTYSQRFNPRAFCISSGFIALYKFYIVLYLLARSAVH